LYESIQNNGKAVIKTLFKHKF